MTFLLCALGYFTGVLATVFAASALDMSTEEKVMGSAFWPILVPAFCANALGERFQKMLKQRAKRKAEDDLQRIAREAKEKEEREIAADAAKPKTEYR